MKILVNGRFSGIKTGVGRVIESLFGQLSEIDHDNEYFIYVNREFEDLMTFANPRFHVISNRIPAANSTLNHLWTQTVFVRKILRHKADLVILPQINLFLIKAAPTIVFQHDLIEYRIPNQKWYKLAFRKAAFPVAFKLADTIVSVSSSTSHDISDLFHVRQGKVVTISNGVNMEDFRPIGTNAAKSCLESKYSISGRFILYVGTLTLPQKNLLRLLDAYQVILSKEPGVKLVMVGGMGKDAELIFERARRLDLGANVIFTGYVPDGDLPYFYSAASVFCFPSLYEGFGLPVLESMACGCPVVASNRASLPEVCGGAAVLVDPEDTECIAESILTFLKNDKMTHEYRVRGLERARSFSWGIAASKLLNVINSFDHRQRKKGVSKAAAPSGQALASV